MHRHPFRHPLAFSVAAGVLAISAVVVLLVDRPAGAASSRVGGRSTIEALTGPACTSPKGFCTQGTLSGGLKGTFVFTASDVIPTVDTPTTGVVVVLGDLTIQVKDGSLLCKDVNALSTTGEGPFASQCTIVGGTGTLAGASGYLLTTGRFTVEAGGEADYSGEVIVP